MSDILVMLRCHLPFVPSLRLHMRVAMRSSGQCFAKKVIGTYRLGLLQLRRAKTLKSVEEVVVTKPLVSILIPAYNAEKWIGYTLESAVGQTWPQKEVIVVDDGSTDQTGEIARQFASKQVQVVTTENRGAAAARNHAFKLSQGDYIQWLDADDLLARDKIERQLEAVRRDDNKRILLSSPWATFHYRTRRAQFVPTRLWQDLPPVEWLARKMGENLYMQTATWLTSRELAEAAGEWDVMLHTDDDGEYFCRVLLASNGTRFVREARVFYRSTSWSHRVSHVGTSDKKKEAILQSMKLHVRYLRSLEESERVRKICLTYLQRWSEHFYLERPDLFAELQDLATQLQGRLDIPTLRWKYAWMEPAFGWKAARMAQMMLPQLKASLIRHWDRMMFALEDQAAVLQATDESNFTRQKASTRFGTRACPK